MSHPHAQEVGGAAIGGILGFAKSFTVLGHISWTSAIETAELALIGAVVGFASTAVLKWAKNKIAKLFKR
jgi:hypothetical protein